MSKGKLLSIVLGAAAIASCASLDGLSNGGGDTPTDAGAEGAPADGSVAQSPFCQTQPDAWLCETFDDRALPGAFADQAATGSSVRLDETDFASPSRSLAVEIPKETTSTPRFGGVGAGLPPSPRTVTLDWKTKIVKAPTPVNQGPRVDTVTLDCGNETDVALYSVIVQMRPTDAGADVWLTSYASATNTVKYLSVFTAVDVVGSWTRFRVMTDWTKGSVELRSVTDTGTVLIGYGTLEPPSALTIPPPWCHYQIGMYSTIAQDGWSARFDDVAIYRE